MLINVAGDLYDSKANGPGFRYVLFTQGCSMGCKGCQNKHTWSKEGGRKVTIDEIIDNLRKSVFATGITLSGGDPMEQPEAIDELCTRISKTMPHINIMIYTGRTLEQLKALNNIHINNILKTAHYLVDGKFECDNTEGARLYTGSANQKIYDLKQGCEIWF